MIENETPITLACKAWRVVLPVHPACEIIPAYENSRLISLGREIKQSGGCKIPTIVLVRPGPAFALLDGRSRLDALCHVGIKFEIKVVDGHVVIDAPGYDIPTPIEIVPDESFNAYAFVLSTNLHRRHLRNEQKRDIVKAVIRAQPNLSDRAVARMAGVDNKTVAKLRLELTANEDLLISREEITGRKARGRKPGQTAKPIVTELIPPAVIAPVVPAVRIDNTRTVSSIVARAKPAAKPDVRDILAAARKVAAVLSRPVSAPNYEEARKEIQHVIELAQSLKPSTIISDATPATTNAKLDRGAFGRALGHAA
jgi:hypothetical protein